MHTLTVALVPAIALAGRSHRQGAGRNAPLARRRSRQHDRLETTMKTLRVCLVILWTVLSPSASGADARGDVRQAFARFISAFNDLDWDRFRNAFSDQVTVFNPDIPEAPSVDRLDGRRQVEDGFKSVFAVSRKGASGPPYLHIVPKDMRVQQLDGVAIVSFEFDRLGNSIGRRTIVFHSEQGKWKIVHIHASNASKRTR